MQPSSPLNGASLIEVTPSPAFHVERKSSSFMVGPSPLRSLLNGSEITGLLMDIRGMLTATIIMFPDFEESFRPVIDRIDKVMGKPPE